MPEGSMYPIICTEQLAKQVISADSPSGGELVLLHDINLTIAHGAAVAIVGASGSGKSTLLGLLAGLDTPSRGRVWIDGTDLFALDEDGRARLRGALIGFVFQSFQLLPNLTALENVMLPLELAGRRDARAVAHAVLARVGLEPRVHHYPRQLSGGEQQRVSISRAIAHTPSVLFADEPTANLDKESSATVMDIFKELHTGGQTIIMVTHEEEFAQFAERIIKIDDGKIVSDIRP